MKVAIFTDNDFDKVNGVTTTLRAALAHAPHDILLKVFTCSSRPTEDRPQYLALRSPGIGIPFYREMRMHWPRAGALLARARQEGIDLVHYTTPGPVGLAAQFVAWRLQVPMVGSFHTNLAEYTATLSGSPHLGALMREYLRWPYGRCARVLVPSEATRRSLEAARIAPGKLRVWPRGVDTRTFTPDRRSDVVRTLWGVGDQRPAVVYAGRLSREKGLEVMPALTRTLAARGLDHQLVFVGDGPMRDELAQDCPGAVFTGTVPHGQVATLLASADLFVFPSRTDTAGNVVLEAQACGLPVVVTDDGGPQEQMAPGLTGDVVAGSSPDAFVDAVGSLVSDVRRRRVLGLEARRFALRRAWSSALAPLYQSYRDVVADARQAGRAPAPMVTGEQQA